MEGYIPYISAGIALTALVISLRGSLLARRALAISEADFNEKRKPLSFYLINRVRVVRDGHVFASFAFAITNGSTTPETITRFELRLYYKDAANELRCTVVSRANTLVLPSLSPTATALAEPQHLPPRSSAQGWLSFEIPSLIATEKLIEKFQVCGQTASGNECHYDVYVLSDAIDHAQT